MFAFTSLHFVIIDTPSSLSSTKKNVLASRIASSRCGHIRFQGSETSNRIASMIVDVTAHDIEEFVDKNELLVLIQVTLHCCPSLAFTRHTATDLSVRFLRPIFSIIISMSPHPSPSPAPRHPALTSLPPPYVSWQSSFSPSQPPPQHISSTSSISFSPLSALILAQTIQPTPIAAKILFKLSYGCYFILFTSSSKGSQCASPRYSLSSFATHFSRYCLMEVNQSEMEMLYCLHERSMMYPSSWITATKTECGGLLRDLVPNLNILGGFGMTRYQRSVASESTNNRLLAFVSF
jgi:hypothetical protein